MQEIADIEIVRTEALRKLGRNIVNFSKIEGCLKLLLAVSEVSGDPKQFSKQVQTKQKNLHKQTLGQLVQGFHKNILSESEQAMLAEDYSGPGISIVLKVVYSDPAFMKAQKKALSKIVAERNHLIHHKLAYLDNTCVDNYHELIVFLDEQNPRLLNHLEEIGSMLMSLNENWEKLKSTTEPSNHS